MWKNKESRKRNLGRESKRKKQVEVVAQWEAGFYGSFKSELFWLLVIEFKLTQLFSNFIKYLTNSNWIQTDPIILRTCHAGA